MQKFLIIIFFLTVVVQNSLAQQNTITRLYAYSRKVIPGIRPMQAEIGKPEQQKEKSYIKTEYFIFLQKKNDSVKIECNRIWIQSKCYEVRELTLTPSPYSIKNMVDGNIQSDTLVAKTTDLVYNLLLGQLINVTKAVTKSVQRTISKNKIVVEIKINGKMFYRTINRIKVLPEFRMI